jgi:RHS repeat-associated protein
MGLEFSARAAAEEISRARVFEEPLAPIGSEPSGEENAALAAALRGYAKRSGPDDFSSLMAFLDAHPASPWRAALLVNLGIEYYNTAYYSRALEAWREAWALGQKATNAAGRSLADRAVCELAGLYSRLGRMSELEALLKSVESRMFLGGATERINLAREALSMMQHQPGISFRCGPLALQSIKRALDPQASLEPAILNSASTQQGFSLAQVEELSRQVGLNPQMAFRTGGAPEFIVPSVVHWKVGHYAALVRQVGDQYLLEDPTFGNSVWATRRALEAETSGYFLVPRGDLPSGWRSVDPTEAGTVWGKGVTGGNDPDIYTPDDLQTGGTCSVGDGRGMAVSSVHLMLANLQIRDTPIGYTPPVGPPVHFTLRYNHRDYLLPPSVNSTVFGPKWTHDWQALIRDSPLNPLADVKYIVGGGGARTFTGFDTNTQTFAPQQYDLTRLRRTGPDSYEMAYPNGSKKIFGLRTTLGSVLLTRVEDPAGNAVTLSWEETIRGVRLIAITDALGQVTTLAYEHPTQPMLITRITDPFGRFATFDYTIFDFLIQDNPPGIEDVYIQVFILRRITDVVGIASQFEHAGLNGIPQSDIITRLITPYGTNTFLMGQGGGPAGTTRFVETHYPDGSRDRVEYNQSDSLGLPFVSEAVPAGMPTANSTMHARNTYYWSRTACATSYGDYTKARIYHWLHTPNITSTSGILESLKEPLENRVWFYYGGHPSVLSANTVNRPTHIGRVLEDGQTQLYRFAYNSAGNITNTVDPVGRTFSYIYASNGVDLLEVRQTRAAKRELLIEASYNSQHLPTTLTGPGKQTTTFTYNTRGQRLTTSNPKGETVHYTYDTNGYLVAIDGALPGPDDTLRILYDSFGRPRNLTSPSGYALTVDYNGLDQVTSITHPDGTSERFSRDRLDIAVYEDRAGRTTHLEYDRMRQLTKHTDPQGRVSRLDWCHCGRLQSLTDAMGRTTSWLTDVQGRSTGKQYPDGSRMTCVYEAASSRVRQVVNARQQVAHFTWNLDDTLRSVAYSGAPHATPGVDFSYDQDYRRLVSMNDGRGITRYSYHPVTLTPTLGAGALARIDGPWSDDTITFDYDALGRVVHRTINGLGLALSFDAAGRLAGATNALGAFTYVYDSSSSRLISVSGPTGQTTERDYSDLLQDRVVRRITHFRGAALISEFVYGHTVPGRQILSWSQKAGAESPVVHTFAYDSVNQLISAIITNGTTLSNAFLYGYDQVGNRLYERIDGANYTATYNSLNELTASSAPGFARTNEWDSVDRLVAVSAGKERTEFTYDGRNQLASIRKLVNGSEVSFRSFLWSDGQVCEERDKLGVVTKRYFAQGMRVETGLASGNYFYTRDHLGSIREVTDASGNVRARYAYDPFGRRSRVAGDLEADFGFAGMFFAAEVNLAFTRFRVYDPNLGRWLSRDPLKNAELIEGPNLYAYVGNKPVSRTDPLGLGMSTLDEYCIDQLTMHYPECQELARQGLLPGAAGAGGGAAGAYAATRATGGPRSGPVTCARPVTPAELTPRSPSPNAHYEIVNTRIMPEDIVPDPVIENLGARITDLAETWHEVGAPSLAEWELQMASARQIEGMVGAGTEVGALLPSELMLMDRIFNNLARALSAKTGLDFYEAWRVLALAVGFNPDTW